MPRLLHIDGSARPGIRGAVAHGSHTRAMTARFQAQWMQHGSHLPDDYAYRDLGLAPPAPVDHAWIEAAFMPPAKRNAAHQQTLRTSDELIAELRQADVLLLGVPMYNFGPPAGVKAWVDQIVRIGETFDIKPDETDGSVDDPYVHLLADRPRSAVLLTSRGGSQMGAGQPLAYLNHLDGALQHALALIGITDFHSIAIEYDEHPGAALTASIAQAMADIDALARQLAGRFSLSPALAASTMRCPAHGWHATG